MRILIAEDDDVLADGLSRSLRRSGYAVDRVAKGTDADASLSRENYDLAVLDIGLPGIDGIEVLNRLRKRGQTVPVLILTARDALEDRVKGLDLGADDYLVKPFAFPELEARIRALIRRGQSGMSSTLSHGPLELDTAGRRVTLLGRPLELPAREFNLLELLLLRSGRIVSKEQILQALCGWEKEITLNAVEVYVHRLRAKLEPAGIAIRTVRGLGYLLEKADES
ncbi:MAG: response regulator [Sulfuricellaceae bacterium]